MSVHVYAPRARGQGSSVVVFVHGAGMDHTVWRYQARWLASRGVGVWAPDLPGHGRSEGHPLQSVEEWAKWLATQIDDLASPTVVGHSMGALVALEAAVAHPDSMDRLVLVGGAAEMPVHPDLLAAAEKDLPRAAAMIAEWSLPPAHTGAHPEPGLWEHGGIRRLLERSRPGVLAADLRACAAYDGTERAKSCSVPTTVVAGSDDRMVRPQASRRLAESIPGARYVEIPGVGHEPMVQSPREFNRLLWEILRSDGKGSAR
ncbi:MAG TPA: alpha/beta hydrolase [Acidimicrobiia bacterium]